MRAMSMGYSAVLIGFACVGRCVGCRACGGLRGQQRDAYGLKVYRKAEGNPNSEKRWRPLRKGVADLYRRAKLSQAANDRYLDKLAA